MYERAHHNSMIGNSGFTLCRSHAVFAICRDGEPVDMTAFADHLAGNYVPNSVIVDATASEAPAQMYLEWMQKGIHIITPNKKLNSGPLSQYRALKQFQRESYIHYLYEVHFLLQIFTGHNLNSQASMLTLQQSWRPSKISDPSSWLVQCHLIVHPLACQSRTFCCNPVWIHSLHTDHSQFRPSLPFCMI